MVRLLYLTEEPIRFDEPMVRGGAIHVRNVVSGLRERGHDVTLVDWNESPDRSFQQSIAPRTRIVDGAVRTLFAATAVGRRTDTEIVVSKTRKTYLPGLLAARRLGVPHVAHVGSSLTSRPGMGNWLGATSFSLRLSAPHDAYLVVCEALGDELRQRGVAGDIFNVRNAVDTNRFTTAPRDDETVERFRQRHESGTEPGLTLGYVGGLHRYKGLFDLADAIDRCSSQVSLLIAGDGPIREEIAERLGDSATLLSAVPYDDVPAVYHASDVFVLPSHTEGLPRVVLEAQAVGTPVIATDVGGVSEVVTDGETGVLCPPHAPDDLAAAIDRLANDPGVRAQIGTNARAAVVDQFSWSALYDRYEQFLSAVCTRSDSRSSTEES